MTVWPRGHATFVVDFSAIIIGFCPVTNNQNNRNAVDITTTLSSSSVTLIHVFPTSYHTGLFWRSPVVRAGTQVRVRVITLAGTRTTSFALLCRCKSLKCPPDWNVPRTFHPGLKCPQGISAADKMSRAHFILRWNAPLWDEMSPLSFLSHGIVRGHFIPDFRLG